VKLRICREEFLKSIALALVLAVTPAAFCAAGELPDLGQFLSSLPAADSVPVPLFPLRTPAAQAASLSGEALFSYLHANTEPALPGTRTDYLKSKKYMFSVADNTGCGGGPGVTCLYSQVCAKGATEHGEDYKENGDQNGDGFVDADGMNAEHAWPQGFFNGALPMRADLHHIFPTFVKPNNTRGSVPYGLVSKPEYSTSVGSKFDRQVFEPAAAVKGDVARAILYFVVRYYDQNIRDGMNYRDFWTSRVQMFLDWNRQDPPDAAEKRRNDLIEKFQGNRNPFVDDPSLADKIGFKVFQAH
jgi:hypothetical protein